jgi:hypothetical protein
MKSRKIINPSLIWENSCSEWIDKVSLIELGLENLMKKFKSNPIIK